MVDPRDSPSGPRYQLILPVVCKAAGQTGRFPQVMSGWTFNLSDTGACVGLPDEFLRGTWLRLTLPLDGKSLVIPVRVGWVAHPGSPGGQTLHGLIFLRLTGKQRQGVQILLRRQRSPQGGPERIPATLPAECRKLGAPGPPLRGWTGDLGREGCSLLLPDQFQAGTRVVVALTGPQGTRSAGATVMWVGSATEGDLKLYRHGIRFLDANPVWEQLREADVAPAPIRTSRTAVAMA